MKIALAQLNPTIGDFEGNCRRIDSAAARARSLGADLCIFPELAVSGYPPHDLLEHARFVADNLSAIDRLAAATRGIALVVGHARPSGSTVGKPLCNAAALLADGRVTSIHAKSLLPTYDVFDEHRYFEPATAVAPAEFRGQRLAITICEDIWNTALRTREPLYRTDPVADLVAKGADIIINIAASPFTLDKRAARPRLLAAAAKRHDRPVVFVNQVGGNDDLVFDGHSLALAADGAILARGAEFEEDLVLVDLASGAGDMRPLLPGDEDAALCALVLGTRDYAGKCGFRFAVVGLSGGIDSAVVAAIAARALGPENVLGVAMPTRYSSKGSLDDARDLAGRLGIRFETVPIDGLFQSFLDTLTPLFVGRAPDVTEENLQARIRGVVLMSLSNKLGHLLLTTGNKSEVATGYCTLYGDMAGGLAVLSDVPKTFVYRIAAALNQAKEIIPRTIIEKPPSAELRPDQKDEDSLPPYSVLDAILSLHVDRGLDARAIAAEGFDEATVCAVTRLVRTSEYKRRQAAPGLKITSKAFGPGRRMPIAEIWKR